MENLIFRGVSLGNSLVLYLLVREYNLYITTIYITDLVLSVLRILRRDLSGLASSMELVDPYNKG